MDSKNKKDFQCTDIEPIAAEFSEHDTETPREGEEAQERTHADLRGTLGAFNTMLQSKKQMQETVVDAEERSQQLRQDILLEALMNIRKALQDISRIDLGERFQIYLGCDDWHGWPRLTVRLNDSLVPENEYPHFQVTANDRHAQGTITIAYHEDQALERLMLNQREDLRNVPIILKKCVRVFLDQVGDIVLETERGEEKDHVEAALAEHDLKDFEETEKEKEEVLSGDLFSENLVSSNILDQLPQVDEISSLPEFSELRPLKK